MAAGLSAANVTCAVRARFDSSTLHAAGWQGGVLVLPVYSCTGMVGKQLQLQAATGRPTNVCLACRACLVDSRESTGTAVWQSCARTRGPDGVHVLDVLEEGRGHLDRVLHRDLRNRSHDRAAAAHARLPGQSGDARYGGPTTAVQDRGSKAGGADPPSSSLTESHTRKDAGRCGKRQTHGWVTRKHVSAEGAPGCNIERQVLSA